MSKRNQPRRSGRRAKRKLRHRSQLARTTLDAATASQRQERDPFAEEQLPWQFAVAVCNAFFRLRRNLDQLAQGNGESREVRGLLRALDSLQHSFEEFQIQCLDPTGQEYVPGREDIEILGRAEERPNVSSPRVDPQLVRAAAFNLAQVLNKLMEYAQAVHYAELGLGLHPTSRGRAIGLAAKGEALMGLNRQAEGQAAFDEAACADPIVGRLNAAEAMVRLGSPALLKQAESWVAMVLASHGHSLDSGLRAEVKEILKAIGTKRGRE
jgi:tetratricopeptide (TPR) repeat protein